MNNSYKKKYKKYKNKYMSLKILNGGSHTTPVSIREINFLYNIDALEAIDPEDLHSVLDYVTHYTGTDLKDKYGVINTLNKLIKESSPLHIDTHSQDTKQTPVPQPASQPDSPYSIEEINLLYANRRLYEIDPEDLHSVLDYVTHYTGTDLQYQNSVIDTLKKLIKESSTLHIDTPRRDTKQTPVPQPASQPTSPVSLVSTSTSESTTISNKYILTPESINHLQNVRCTLNTYNIEYKIFHYTRLSSDFTFTNDLITYENILFDDYNCNQFIINLINCNTHNILFVLEYDSRFDIIKFTNILINIQDILDKLKYHLQNVTIYNIVKIVSKINHYLFNSMMLKRNIKVRKINNIIIKFTDDIETYLRNIIPISITTRTHSTRFLDTPGNVNMLTETFWYKIYFEKLICRNKRLEQYGLHCWLLAILNCIILNQYIINEILTPFNIDNLCDAAKCNKIKIKSIKNWDKFISTVNKIDFTMEQYILIFFNILLNYNIKPRTYQDPIINMIAYKIYYDYVNQFNTEFPKASIIRYEDFYDLWDSIYNYFPSKFNLNKFGRNSSIKFLPLVKHATFAFSFIDSCAYFIHKLLFNDTIYIYNAFDCIEPIRDSIISKKNIIMYICKCNTKKIKSTLFPNFEPTSAVLLLNLGGGNEAHVISAFKCNDKYYLYDSNYVEDILEYSWIDTPIQIDIKKTRFSYKYIKLLSVVYVIYTRKNVINTRENVINTRENVINTRINGWVSSLRSILNI